MERFILCNKERYNRIVEEAKGISEAWQRILISQICLSRSAEEGFYCHSRSGDTCFKQSTDHAYFWRYDAGISVYLWICSEIQEDHPKTPLISARNKEKDFEELCKLVGPPSRVMRWCCTIFKTGTIQKRIKSLYRDKNQILTFYGIRRSESLSRSKYERESDSPKITKQRIVSPIIDWMDFDIWLYILTSGIDFNDAYRLGYARVGCWCCPEQQRLVGICQKSICMSSQSRFRTLLIRFRQK